MSETKLYLPNAVRILSSGFGQDESIMSLGGPWVHGARDGTAFHDIQVVNGIACQSTKNLLGNIYDDAMAIHVGTGWSPNVIIESLVSTQNQQTGSTYQEIEHRHRTNISNNVCTGYEINWRVNHDGSQYHQVAYWYGILGTASPSCVFGCAFDFVPGSVNPGGNGMGAGDGYQGLYHLDTIGSSMIGNRISTWIIQGPNAPSPGVRIDLQSFLDTGGAGGGAKYTTGYPGIGHWHHGAGGSTTDFGHKTLKMMNG